MSKASEWISRYAEVKAAWPPAYTAPPTNSDSRKADARVTEAGQCRITLAPYASLDPDIALALARWILDTFGEAP